ncbi:circadian regulator cryptochrome [Arctopsyche grandis]|uniref:circadian regulator cryptochrome n=1 Tax=Arctopsyche grandis TaxID=121162 RepID=UPI00406D94A6
MDRKHGGSVLWFRHGLRLHDNPAHQNAVKNPEVPFYPIFIFDGESAGTKLIGYNRMRYLLESLDDINNQYKIFGGRLYMFSGKPDVIIRRLWEELGITDISLEQDCEPIWTNRDSLVKYLCRDIGVVYNEFVSHTLWDPAKVIKANGGIPPLTFQMFLHTVETIGLPARPVDDVDFKNVKFGIIPPYLCNELLMFEETPKPEDFGILYETQLDELPMIRWTGGETLALRLFSNRLQIEAQAFIRGSFLPTHSNLDLLGPPISLSPALRFGCLSIRKFYWGIRDLFNQVHGNSLEAIPQITGQLIWREYFYTMSVNNPNYGQMENNPICLDIGWYNPNSFILESWKQGKTGFPFIDAAMRQLKREGWLHHTVRNAVASFLTRGTLWYSWEHGLQHFLKYLLDADWSVCAGNWMWVSSSAFEALLDSSACACPVNLGRRLDPSGEYVRRYVQELRNMPEQFIYEPWKAPIEVQEKANCVIGRDYPNRLVNHKTASEMNRSKMENLRISLQNTLPHCCPSNEEEIRKFMWLPDEISDMVE